MKFFSYYSITNFSNCYLVGQEGGRDALLIDPGIFDEGLLKLVEDNGFYVRHVLITHTHHAHINGIRTLLKIYEAAIYCLDPGRLEFPVEKIGEASPLGLPGFSIEVLETPGHSNDSACFKIERLLFTGDTLSAGSIGNTSSGYERALLLSSIRSKILTQEDTTFIFPGHGPPTTLEIEKRFNPYLKDRL